MIKSKTSVLDVNDIFFNRLTNSANISTTGAGDLLAAREKPPLQHFNFCRQRIMAFRRGPFNFGSSKQDILMMIKESKARPTGSSLRCYYSESATEFK